MSGAGRGAGPIRNCPNCGHSIAKGGHFVPPSFGDEGFFACEGLCDECKPAAEPIAPPSPQPCEKDLLKDEPYTFAEAPTVAPQPQNSPARELLRRILTHWANGDHHGLTSMRQIEDAILRDIPELANRVAPQPPEKK